MMKTLKHLFSLLACCMLAIVFFACEKDEQTPNIIRDFYPINIYFTLTGENGEDLLNPATPGTYAKMRITATYEDKIYEKDVFEDNTAPFSRDYCAILNGLHTTLNGGRYLLVFGEFNGDDTYRDATITLNWGDGTIDTVTFSSNLKWKGHNPHITRSFELNGIQVAKDTHSPIINIKKSAL